MGRRKTMLVQMLEHQLLELRPRYPPTLLALLDEALQRVRSEPAASYNVDQYLHTKMDQGFNLCSVVRRIGSALAELTVVPQPDSAPDTQSDAESDELVRTQTICLYSSIEEIDSDVIHNAVLEAVRLQREVSRHAELDTQLDRLCGQAEEVPPCTLVSATPQLLCYA